MKNIKDVNIWTFGRLKCKRLINKVMWKKNKRMDEEMKDGNSLAFELIQTERD